jgi:hypothetical protein
MGDTGFRFGPSMSYGTNLNSSRGRHQSMVRSAYSAGNRMYGSLPQRGVMGAGELMGMADAFSKGHQVVWKWHINADGVLEADEGDNAITLALYMGSSVEEAFYSIFQNQGFRKIKKGDVVTPYLPAVDIVLEEEPPIYGTYMGVPGQLNAKPNTGVLLATAMSEFTANFLTFMASLGTSSTARTPDLVIMAARSQVKSAVVVAAKTGVSKLPTQIHHFATNKHSVYTTQMNSIAQKYGLKLDGSWNKSAMPHLGRHPNDYHNFVLQRMQDASNAAGNSQAKFLQFFDAYVKQPVLKNPNLLNKSGW